MCQALDSMHGGWRQGEVQELLGKALQMLAHPGKRGGGWQKWTIRVLAGEGGGREPDKGADKEGLKAHHIR